MDRVLSQEEIEALFSAMSSEVRSVDRRPGQTPATSKTAFYDSGRVERTPQGRLRSVHSLHEAFARSFAASLSVYLRTVTDVSMTRLKQTAYSAFIESLPDPTLFSRIGVRPLDAYIAMTLNPSTAFAIIDRILDRPGQAETKIRSMTPIDLDIVAGVLEIATKAFATVWRPILELDSCLEGIGTRAGMFQIASPAEPVISAHFKLNIGENTGTMDLCIPCSLWDKKLPVSILFASTEMPLEDALNLDAGSVIELDKPLNNPVTIIVNHKPVAKGEVVLVGGNYGIRILEAESAADPIRSLD